MFDFCLTHFLHFFWFLLRKGKPECPFPILDCNNGRIGRPSVVSSFDPECYTNIAGLRNCREQMGRGRNARFPTILLEYYGGTDPRTDKASFRVASPRLKTGWKKVETKLQRVSINDCI